MSDKQDPDLPARTERWGGKGRAWHMKLSDEQDLRAAVTYSLNAAKYHEGGVRFHLGKMDEDLSARRTVVPSPEAQQHYEKFHHNLRAFFWELTAAFDALLQHVNRELMLKIDPRDVSWTTISHKLSETPKFKDFLKKVNAEYSSPWFTEIREYRNFAHRGTLLAEVGGVPDDPPDPKAKRGYSTIVMLVPLAGRRGYGEASAVCKHYGEKLGAAVQSTLEELDRLTTDLPKASNES